eukprot:7102622-Pyramimonas_sp.AAC.1
MCQIIDRLCDMRVSWSVENPNTSILWHTPSWLKVLVDYEPTLILWHMCQYGEIYKKPTRLYTWAPDTKFFLGKLANTCNGGHTHVSLSGWDWDHPELHTVPTQK